jgi:tetratricopeptide (TPR) repeat protein
MKHRLSFACRLRRASLAAIGAPLCVALGVGMTPGCAPGPGESTELTEAFAAVRPTTVVRPNLPPPPGISNGELTRHVGPALAKAQLGLDDILAAHPVPAAQATELAASDGRPPVRAVQTYVVARAAYEQGDLQRAQQLLLQVVQIDPASVEAFRLLGQVYLDRSITTRAGIYLNQALALRPGDPATLCQLGRLAFHDARWSDAIAAIGHARQANGAALDPAVLHLTDYQLGIALLEAGYDVAAIDHLTEYLAKRGAFDRSTRYLRHMAALVQRRPSVHVQIGDALIRLGRFADADSEYQQVAGDPSLKPEALLPRLVYLDLTFGLDAVATKRLVEFDWATPSTFAPELAVYVARHVRKRATFVSTLRRLAAETEGPARENLAIAVAGVLPAEEAEAYLAEHLAAAPGDEVVFAAWVERLLNRDPAAAIARTAALIAGHPDYASVFAQRLLRAAGKATDLAELCDTVEADDHPAAVAYLRGMVKQNAKQLDEAETAYREAIDADATFAPAQLALIEVMLLRRQYDKALEAIDAVTGDPPPRLRLFRAGALQGLGRGEQALSVLDELTTEYPENTDYLLRKALLLEQQKEYAQLEEIAARVLQIDLTSEPAYAALFRVYRQHTPDGRKFLLLLRKLQQVNPTSTLARYQSAYLSVVRGELPKAEAALRQLYTETPTDLGVLRDLVAVLGRQDRWPEAQTLVLAHLDSHPVNAASLDLLRQVVRQTRDEAAFLTRYETFLKGQPESAENALRLSAIYYEQKKLDQAIAQQLRAMELADAETRPAHRRRLIELYAEAERYDEALAQVDRLITAEPTDAGLYRTKAFVLSRAKRYADAAQTLRDALARETNSPVDLRVALAGVYVDLKQLDAAVEQMDKAIAEAPRYAAELHYRKSHLFVRAGQSDRAEDALKASLAVDEDYVPANNDLGYMWAERGVNLTQARAMTAKAVAAEPENAAYLDSLGWVYYKLGEFKQAAQALTKATALPGGNDPVLHDHLGDAQWRLGKREAAQASWKQALKLLAGKPEGMQRDDAKLKASLEAKLQAAGDGTEPPTAALPAAEEEVKQE